MTVIPYEQSVWVTLIHKGLEVQHKLIATVLRRFGAVKSAKCAPIHGHRQLRIHLNQDIPVNLVPAQVWGDRTRGQLCRYNKEWGQAKASSSDTPTALIMRRAKGLYQPPCPVPSQVRLRYVPPDPYLCDSDSGDSMIIEPRRAAGTTWYDKMGEPSLKKFAQTMICRLGRA